MKVRFSSLYAKESEAQEAQASVQGLLNVAGMFLRGDAAGPDGKPDPKKAANAAKLKKIISALKVSSSGKTLDLAFDFPTADSVSLLREEAAKISKNLGN